MSPIKVYAHRLSQPSRAVIIFCRVNRIDFQEVTVDLFKKQHLAPEFKSTLQTCLPEPKLSQSWIGITRICDVVQALGYDTRDRFLGGHEKILTWMSNVKKATSPHFEEAHMLLFEVKGQMQSKAAAAAAAEKHNGSEPSSKLKITSRL